MRGKLLTGLVLAGLVLTSVWHGQRARELSTAALGDLRAGQTFTCKWCNPNGGDPCPGVQSSCNSVDITSITPLIVGWNGRICSPQSGATSQHADDGPNTMQCQADPANDPHDTCTYYDQPSYCSTTTICDCKIRWYTTTAGIQIPLGGGGGDPAIVVVTSTISQNYAECACLDNASPGNMRYTRLACWDFSPGSLP